MRLPSYTKLHSNPSDLIQHLLQCGLRVPNPAFAEAKIKEIGHERLRIYFRSRRQTDIAGKPFVNGTTFENIEEIYRFDERLRLTVLRYCSRVEVILRNTVSETITETHGPHPYNIIGLYKDMPAMAESLKSTSDICIKKMKRDPRAKHYYSNYGGHAFPPIWVLKEFWTFGAMNHFFQRLDNGVANTVASKLHIPNQIILSNWIDCFVDVRNVCAHHDRLFNRAFTKSPQRIRNINVPANPNVNKIVAVCECMNYILGQYDNNVNIVQDLTDLLNHFPSVSAAEIGI